MHKMATLFLAGALTTAGLGVVGVLAFVAPRSLYWRPSYQAINGTGGALDRAVPLLASTAPGTLHANYHVEAVR